jgi:diguanylate cyclase (GGDEF)-like protein
MPAGKYQLLVVDSSSANRVLIGECLAQLDDVNVTLAADGSSAVELIASTQPDLILVDMNLRDMDGISLVRKIRNRELLASGNELNLWTPVIFLSSVMDEDMLAQGIIAGGDDFLHKPVSEVILLAKIRALLRIVGMQRDIHAAHRRLKQIATLDGLTCIPNRRYFDDTLRAEWKRCQRASSPLSLILIDIDYFKQFNDAYGHQAGDQCLKAVAGALNESLFRVEDSVARYGGEEFAAILPGTDARGALAVAERMRASTSALGIPHKHGIGGFISCSLGVASTHPAMNQTAEQLVQTTDKCLYEAKHAGRNRTIQNAAWQY